MFTNLIFSYRMLIHSLITFFPILYSLCTFVWIITIDISLCSLYFICFAGYREYAWKDVLFLSPWLWQTCCPATQDHHSGSQANVWICRTRSRAPFREGPLLSRSWMTSVSSQGQVYSQGSEWLTNWSKCVCACVCVFSCWVRPDSLWPQYILLKPGPWDHILCLLSLPYGSANISTARAWRHPCVKYFS